MKKTNKIILFLIVLAIALMLIPNFSKATTYTVNTAEDFADKVSSAETGDTINLGANIALSSPIEVTGEKSIIINGNGHTISRNTETWQNNVNNGTLLTVGADATLTLNNLNLRGAAKYGAQAYNGGRLILNGVTVADCEYGGILVNGGTLEIIDLTLYRNRNNGDANNGIEIGKGENVTETPKIVMNGSLESTVDENVIYFDNDDELTGFEIENTPNTQDKLLVNDNGQVVVTDEYNNILYESNEVEGIDIEGNEYHENVIVTINLSSDKSVQIGVEPGTALTKERAMAAINLESLGLNNYQITGFYTTAEYTTEFNFETPITGATTIYAKLDPIKSPEPPKDETPKTGVNDVLEIAISLLVVSLLAAFILRKKEI